MKSYQLQWLFTGRLIFFIGIVGGGGAIIQLGPISTAATNRPIVPGAMIMTMEKLVEWLAGEIEVLEKILPQCRFVYHKPHMLPGREPGPPQWEASD
jgi:hypothetical protein